jgi:subtilisin family serine protease
MRIHWLVKTLLLLVLAAPAVVARRAQFIDEVSPSPPPAASAAPDALLVAFRSDVPPAQRLRTVSRFSLEVDPKVQSPHFARLRIGAAARGIVLDLQSTLATLRQDPNVRVVQPDCVRYASEIPNDTDFGSQWALNNTGQSGGTPGADIHAPAAWDRSTGSDSVIVAVVDSGVDYRHPDLTDNILRDSSGAVVGYDFANNDADPMDDNDHGTHCAGIIGARGNNGIGISGVCQRVKIMPLKFMDRNGSGFDSDAIKSIDFAIAHGARVISASWGSDTPDQLLLEAIQRARDAGVLFVTAAGNGNSHGIGQDNGRFPSFPANYNAQSSNVVSVAATTRTDVLASWSNYGATSVDIAAPGQTILSTVPGSSYVSLSGTSMATPHVAGAAALALAVNPGLTLAQLKSALLSTTDHPSGLTGKLKSGRLNLYRLVQSVAPAGSTFSISGTITQGSAGLAGVQVAAGGQSATTAADGSYTLSGLPAGSYTVTPSKSGASFTPASRSVTVGPDQTGEDFMATAGTSTFSISGAVSSAGGGLAGVTVSAENQSATTAANGVYALTGLPPGTYTVVPSRAGYSFTPASRQVTLTNASVSGVSFGATPTPSGFTISGAVRQGSAGVAGVTITSGSASATTAADGTYRLTGLAAGTYTLRPSLSGFTFTPASQTVTVGPDQAGIDFGAGTSAALASLTVSPTSIRGGTSVRGTVSLTAPAPASLTVTVATSSLALTSVPARVIVPAGARSASFTVLTRLPKVSTAVTLSATYQGVTTSARLIVHP